MAAPQKNSPVIVWFRQDLRLQDNPALKTALETGRAIIPLYILDDKTPGKWKHGGASRWWLHNSLTALDASLQKNGFHPLVFLKGDAFVQLLAFAKKIKASSLYWNRYYTPWAIERDTRIKNALKEEDVTAESFGSFLMFEPWEIKNKAGDPYKVFTAFSKTCGDKKANIRTPLKYKLSPAKHSLAVTELALNDLDLMPKIKWYQGMDSHWTPGEVGAQKRLEGFSSSSVFNYKKDRDYPAIDGVSRLSPHLHFGEVSPHQIWHAVSKNMEKQKNSNAMANAEGYLRQLIWREFSYHLLYHAPNLPEKPWNKRFTDFPWQRSDSTFENWKLGKTGYPIVDAGMRELWQTGWMHNRVRMIVGSFLVKNLLIDWRAGEDWFWDTLVDADLGNNASGWQWIAGCGADAAPYFRIFNPILQSKKFDPDGVYIRKYVPEIKDLPNNLIHTPWKASPIELKSANISLGVTYPRPIVDINQSRDRALEAYGQTKPE